MAEKKSKGLLRTGYISELDQFLRDFDQSRTQFVPERLKEIAKHRWIADRRDNIVDEQPNFIWQNF